MAVSEEGVVPPAVQMVRDVLDRHAKGSMIRDLGYVGALLLTMYGAIKSLDARVTTLETRPPGISALTVEV